MYCKWIHAFAHKDTIDTLKMWTNHQYWIFSCCRKHSGFEVESGKGFRKGQHSLYKIAHIEKLWSAWNCIYKHHIVLTVCRWCVLLVSNSRALFVVCMYYTLLGELSQATLWDSGFISIKNRFGLTKVSCHCSIGKSHQFSF